jgi:alkanesulfonate monooxygenase SsuD/methylene tetrahydromethanopterin reductase-like flavin-dependent oxidoreductase (luciferase family)
VSRASTPTRPEAYLAAEVQGACRHPAAWRLPDARPTELFTPGYWTDLAQVADAAGLDFLAIPGSFLPPAGGEEASVRGWLDAVAIAPCTWCFSRLVVRASYI